MPDDTGEIVSSLPFMAVVEAVTVTAAGIPTVSDATSASETEATAWSAADCRSSSGSRSVRRTPSAS